MSCTVLISEFAAPSRPISCSSFHKQDQPQTSLQLPLQQGACNEQGSEERQQDAHRLASCMSDHPHPYVWNSASQRYEPRTSSYAADSQQQQQQECQQQQQPHSGYRVASPPSRVLNDYRPQPPLDDWNPWAYLDSSSQRPYTPSQPAVGADLPSQYDPYRLPSIQQQGLADAYDPHNYQAPGSGSSYSASVRRAAATTHQGQLPYLQENYSSSHYHGWTPEASRGSFAEAYPETFILPPLNRQYPATAVNPTSTSQTQQLTYQPNDRALPLDLQAPRPSRHDPSSLSATGLPSYHDFSSKTPRTASSEATDYFPSAIRQRSLSDPALTWEEFQSHWKGYISSAESLLREQAKRGELAGFIYHNMAQPLPTLDSCDVSSA